MTVRPLPFALAAVLCVALSAGCGERERPADSTGKGAANGGEPAADSAADAGPAFRFREATAEAGVDFVHTSGTIESRPIPASAGSGVATADFDRDGAPDLFFATATPFPLAGPAAGEPGDVPPDAPRDALYRGLSAFEPRYEEVAALAGVDSPQFSAGAAVGDFDGDGFPDLYVTAYGPNRLYRNNGDGTFTLTAAAKDDAAEDGTARRVGGGGPEQVRGRWSTGAAFFDADGDGNPDLYVANYGLFDLATVDLCGTPEHPSYCHPTTIEPAADAFFANAGDGNWPDRTEAAGFAAARPGRSLGVLAADLEPDGDPDLYVACDVSPNPLFLNGDADGGPAGHFTEAGTSGGVAYDRRGEMQGGMGVAAGDADGDGLLDLAVSNYSGEHFTLYRAKPGRYYEDAGHDLGLDEGTRPWIGWGTLLADLDGDGDEDLVVVNGHTDEDPAASGLAGVRRQPAQLYRADGPPGGPVERFVDVAARSGDFFAEPQSARGLAGGFFDAGLTPDLLAGGQDEGPALLLNETADFGAVVRVRVVGTAASRDAVGATIAATAADGRTALRPVIGGGSYLSASDPRVLLPAAGGSCEAVVRWPFGGEQTFAGLAAGGDYLLVQGGRAVRLDE